ncbi:hypothetical protein IV59_GL000293 [Paucilactobacillus hokkaidonensis]|uniref:Uncharacterized protein n=1 Tax=Paucilactobacillus hokkaidonensis TaxID=1193095 RepID=A0ABR5Q5D1_9LACO|nr:hypothetical protein IV59_GL000293 [Paucilactobacillus hokkaidonensis]
MFGSIFNILDPLSYCIKLRRRYLNSCVPMDDPNKENKVSKTTLALWYFSIKTQ